METNVSKKDEMMLAIQTTPAQEIADLGFVRDRFIDNYNKANRTKNGDMMYYRQVVHFKQQIAGDENLKTADKFSLYACFITAGVKGYSFDPEDKEVYLLALKGKAVLWRQAGAHVRRLIQTNQCKYVEQAKLVYKGDFFEVKNVKPDHIERFETEEIIAGYAKFILDDKGTERYFIYRKSDFASWRKKSQRPDGENWNYNGSGQPGPGFLRTKIIKHACQEKCWAIGSTPPGVEQFENVEIEDYEPETKQKQGTTLDKSLGIPASEKKSAITDLPVDDFVAGENGSKGKKLDIPDDDFA